MHILKFNAADQKSIANGAGPTWEGEVAESEFCFHILEAPLTKLSNATLSWIVEVHSPWGWWHIMRR